MYAIVKTGGKQYRVEQGQSLLVERLPASEGDTVALEPLLCVDGERLVDGSDLSRVSVSARVVGHERGPKLRVVKFKPKRGYKRRTGHRQDLSRIEVTAIKVGAARRGAAKASDGAEGAAETAPAGAAGAAAPATKPQGDAAATKPQGDAAATKPQGDAPATKPRRPRSTPKPKDSDGS
jgi:large subunit ribosomal protein L21